MTATPPETPSTPRGDELLPCPLCGGRAQFAVRRHGSYMDKTYDIFCTECFFGSNSGFLDKDKIFEFWNTRPAQAALSEEEIIEILARSIAAVFADHETLPDYDMTNNNGRYTYDEAGAAAYRALTSQNRGGR